MSNNNNNWKRIGGFSRTGTQNYVRTNDGAMGGTTFGSTDVSNNTGNLTQRIGNNAGVIFINGDIDLSGGEGIAAPINRIKNVRDPSNNQDVATKYYVDKKVEAINLGYQSIGPTGPDGPPGIGFPGQPGSDGQIGPTGVTGPQGPRGDITEISGPAGPAGPRGATGATGAMGATGPAGAAGAQGVKGDQGTQGIQGSNGTILWLNPDGDTKTNELIIDSYLLSQFPINSSMRTVGPISVSATYGNANKMIPASRFWNVAPQISALSVIPSGVWVVNLYAAVPSNSDANQVSLYAAIFMITGTESQPSPDSLIIETKEGGDAGYYPPRAAYLPDHVKYIGRSWETTSTPINTQNTLTNNTTGVVVTSTAKNLYKIQIPVDFFILKDSNGNANNVYLQLQIYVKNTKTLNQSANVTLYYQTDPATSETTYSYLQTTFGAVGSIGPSGTPGTVGPTGGTGPLGLNGATGHTGVAGEKGPTGPRGPTGPQGPTGPTGPAGQSNSFGVQHAVQYRSNLAPLGATDASGSFGGSSNFRFVPGPVGYTTNAPDASMGTVVMNDLACNSIHSSFYIENPSIVEPNVRPRTFIRSGGYKVGDNSNNFVIFASGKNTATDGGTTQSPATPADITHGIKLYHKIDEPTPNATIEVNDDNKTGKVCMKFDLTTGDIIAADNKFCVLNTSGRVGVGGITQSEMGATLQSGLNRALHVSGNVMVGTHPGTTPSTIASSAMIMLNAHTTAPTVKTYPGIYHRSVLGTAATTLGLTDSSGGLGITAPNFITFQTGTGTLQSNSIVIDSAGNVSMMGRTNLTGRVGIGRNFQDNSTHGGVQSIFDVSGTTHISNSATTYGGETPRIKLISSSISNSADTPNLSQTANEIRGVNSAENSGFLRLTAQSPANSCIDLVGANTNSGNVKNNSVRISTGGIERMIINAVGNVGINTALPTVPLDVTGAARITGGLNMVSTQINNLRDPSGNQDAATKLYVDTATTNMATTAAVNTAITTALSSGTTANNPTISTTGAPATPFRIVLSAGEGIRQPLYNDGNDLTYVPSTNTLTVSNAAVTSLDVSGNANLRNTVFLSSTTGTTLDVAGNAMLRSRVRIGSNLVPDVPLDVTGMSRMTAASATTTALTTTGRVGVNTATPTAALDVSGNAKIGDVRIGVTPLYEFTSHTFTNAGATGRTGPTLTAVRSAYSTVTGASWTQDTTNNYLNMSSQQGIQLWTVPVTGSYTIRAAGAAGGRVATYGKGRDVALTTTLIKGEIIKILVGQVGINQGASGSGGYASGGGGGGTFVIRATQTPIVVAGGGAGAGYADGRHQVNDATISTSGQNNSIGTALGGVNGSGGQNIGGGGSGGGLLGDGYGSSLSLNGKGFISGGIGGEEPSVPAGGTKADGGFGGGGANNGANMGGGGGGYSGGAGGGVWPTGPAGGGGSFGITALTDYGAINAGHGSVIITLIPATQVILDVSGGAACVNATSATATALTTTGRIGVNTATPTATLDVSGSANVSNSLSVGSGGVGNGATTSNIPNAFYVRTGSSNWKDYIPLLVADSTTNILVWGDPDAQWFDVTYSAENEIAKQYSYFAGYWLNANRAVVGTSFSVESYAGTGANPPISSRGTFTFTATAVTNGVVTAYNATLTQGNHGSQPLTPQPDGINAGLARISLSNRTLLMGGNVETGYLAVTGAARITGGLNMVSTRINNLLDPSALQDAATKSYVDSSIPIGGVIMWHGTGASLPSNWKLCDGTTYGSITTPDLRSRFVVGASLVGGSGLQNKGVVGTEVGQLGLDISNNELESLGKSVSISADGSTVAIRSFQSVARVYRFNNIQWSKLGSDLYGDSGNFGNNGIGISADGNTVVVGSPSFNDSRGSFRIYRYINNQWNESAYVTNSDQTYAGYCVSISADGNTVAVGYPFKIGDDNYQGAVRLFRYSNTSWSQLTPTINGFSVAERFGESLSVSADGNIVAIGAPNYQNKGMVRVYRRYIDDWTQFGELNATTANEYFGNSVSISADGNTVAASGGYGGIPGGVTRVYRYSNNSWQQLGSNIIGTDQTYSGSSVSISANGNTVAIGNRYYPNFTNQGVTRIYRLINNIWSQLGSGENILGNAAGEEFGTSVSISADGTTVAIGAPAAKIGSITRGVVRVYKSSSSFTNFQFAIAFIMRIS